MVRPTAACSARSKSSARRRRSSVVVAVRVAGAPDDDPVGLDHDLDLPLAGLAVWHEPVLAFERLDLLDGDLQLVRDPRVGAALADPGADLAQVRSKRSSGHTKGAILVETVGGASGRPVKLQSDIQRVG